MTVHRKALLLWPFLVCPALGPHAAAYELATHARLTEAAFGRSILSDAKFMKELGVDSTAPSPFGDSYYDVSGADVRERKADPFEARFMPVRPEETLTLPAWLMRGAIREDDWISIDRPGCRLEAPNPNDDRLSRPANHFYDPVHNMPLTVGLPLGEKAPDWALGTANFLADPPPPNGTRANHYSLLDAREAQYRALTGRNKDDTELATTEEERNKYWATAFRALGDVLHLIEDMAQPQHTRNDAHLGCRPYSWVAGEKSVFERYIEDRATGAPYQTPGGQIVRAAGLDYLGAAEVFPAGHPLPRLRDYASFFTTRHRDADIAARRGLADYSNRGFFSAGKNLDPRPDAPYEHPSNNFPSYGRVELTTNWEGKPFGGSVSLLTGAVPDAQTGVTAANVPLTSVGVWDQFLEERNLFSGYTLNRHNYDAQAALLIPRAVAYSAGLIDHFFRGRLEIQDAGFTEAGVVLRVKNAIDPRQQAYWKDEALGAGGKLVVARRYRVPDAGAPNGWRTHYHTSSSATLAETLKPGRASDAVFTFTGLPTVPAEAREVEYRLVFRGRLGNESDAVVAGTFTPLSGFVVTPNYAPADGLGGPRLVYRVNGEWRLSDQTGILAGNTDWKGWYRDGKATKVLSWVGPQARYFADEEYCQQHPLPNSSYYRCRWISTSAIGNEIYEGGALLARAPGGVLGAAVVRDNQGEDWLVVICKEGAADVVYRRPYKRSDSIALYDEMTHPDGWKAIGRYDGRQSDQAGVRLTHEADIPWFFSGDGREAQTLRRWWDFPSGDVRQRQRRVKLAVDADVASALPVPVGGDEGNLSGSWSRECSGSYDADGAGQVQATWTDNGAYVIAADYTERGEQLATLKWSGSGTTTSVVNVAKEIDPKTGQPVVVAQTGAVDQSDNYRETMDWGSASLEVWTQENALGARWSSGKAGSNYTRTISDKSKEHEIAYYLDLRHGLFSFYEWGWTESEELARSGSTVTQANGNSSFSEQHLILADSGLGLEPKLVPHSHSSSSTYAADTRESYRVDCNPSYNQPQTTSYGYPNFGWLWDRPVGGWAVDSEGRVALSQKIYRDGGYELKGPYSYLTAGALADLIPGAPGANAAYYPIMLVR